jgi:hypothetical protein
VASTPGICRKVASTPQKQPAANVAFSIFRLLLVAPLLDDEFGRKSRFG